MVEYQVWNKSRSQTWFFDVIFSSRTEAEFVLDEMIGMAKGDEKKRVSMHSYFSLCNIWDNHEELTKCLKWPLETVSKTKIQKVDKGYIIALPKMVIIDA